MYVFLGQYASRDVITCYGHSVKLTAKPGTLSGGIQSSHWTLRKKINEYISQNIELPRGKVGRVIPSPP